MPEPVSVIVIEKEGTSMPFIKSELLASDVLTETVILPLSGVNLNAFEIILNSIFSNILGSSQSSSPSNADSKWMVMFRAAASSSK